MNREEFIETCVRTGYCSRKIAREYAGDRDDFNEEDFIAAHRYASMTSAERREVGQKKRPLGNGQYTTKHYTVYNGHDEH